MDRQADAFSVIDFSFAKHHKLFVKNPAPDAMEVLLSENATPTGVLELMRLLPNVEMTWHLLDDEMFARSLNTYYENIDSETLIDENLMNDDIHNVLEELPESEDLLESQESAPIIKLLNSLLSQAIKMSASDIHFEVFRERFLVRFRIDGVLHSVHQLKKHVATLLISRIKVMAKLDIAEKKIPQDGRINLKIAGRDIDVRVSVLPSNHGERAVLRILDKKNAKLDLSHLGASDHLLETIESMIQHPHGILLVTGPTGSGKTTTLYAALSKLNTQERNILTVEDPIEYDLEGIGQTAVNPKVGMTFAKGLRAILRQDPDVIMVGEIRDKETANIAIEASLTGHLVLSTLHTNHAVGALVRLHDMGIQNYLLASSLLGVIAQRLVRRLCEDCKAAYKPDRSEQKMLAVKSSQVLYRPNGCEGCNHIGYKGRIGLYEILFVDDTLRKLIHDGAAESELVRHVRKQYVDIRTDGFARVILGETSLEEVLRVTQNGNELEV